MSTELVSNYHTEFKELVTIIEHSRSRAFLNLNIDMLLMYWEVGANISDKIKNDDWGKSVVDEFSDFIKINRPELKGFSSSNVWRMRQYYETYQNNPNLATLSREVTWSNNMLIMSRAKTAEARELKRQMDSLIYERTMISNEKNQLVIAKNVGLTA